MKEQESTSRRKDRPGSRPVRVRLPGFITEEQIGLGDAIQRASYAMGIRPCGGCARRAAALNRWVVFSGGHR